MSFEISHTKGEILREMRNYYLLIRSIFLHIATACSGPGIRHHRGTAQSVGLLWTSDRSDAETST
jgi:hypothetical protein